jgi:hypothetical protein
MVKQIAISAAVTLALLFLIGKVPAVRRIVGI